MDICTIDMNFSMLSLYKQCVTFSIEMNQTKLSITNVYGNNSPIV